MVDWLALIVASVALIISTIQFVDNSFRQQKEATLLAYKDLQTDVSDIICCSNKTDICLPISDENKSSEWIKVTECLSKIERFSVGINTGVYSIHVLNRMGGSYFIYLFENLKPVISYKRKENKINGSHYDEFELVVNKLREYRSAKSKTERMRLRIKWLVNR